MCKWETTKSFKETSGEFLAVFVVKNTGILILKKAFSENK